jgi:hypothetical protein
MDNVINLADRQRDLPREYALRKRLDDLLKAASADPARWDMATKDQISDAIAAVLAIVYSTEPEPTGTEKVMRLRALLLRGTDDIALTNALDEVHLLTAGFPRREHTDF